MRASEIFQSGWFSFQIPGLRPARQTYELTDYHSLPQLPQFGPDLVWLTPLHPKIDEKTRIYRLDDEARKAYGEKRERIMAQARSLHLDVPDTFERLTGSFELQGRIPSCTACYFDLPESIVESPFREGDRLIRFLNDQQICVCWYLYLAADEAPFVIASGGVRDEPFLDAIDFAKKGARSIDVAREHTVFVAESFDEFIYRFWIENCIWFHLNEALPLSRCQLDYVRSIDPSWAGPSTVSRRGVCEPRGLPWVRGRVIALLHASTGPRRLENGRLADA